MAGEAKHCRVLTRFFPLPSGGGIDFREAHPEGRCRRTGGLWDFGSGFRIRASAFPGQVTNTNIDVCIRTQSGRRIKDAKFPFQRAACCLPELLSGGNLSRISFTG